MATVDVVIFGHNYICQRIVTIKRGHFFRKNASLYSQLEELSVVTTRPILPTIVRDSKQCFPTQVSTRLAWLATGLEFTVTDACAAVILSNYTGLHVEFTGANLIMLKLCSLTLGILLSDPPLLNKRPFQWIVSLFKNDLSLLFLFCNFKNNLN